VEDENIRAKMRALSRRLIAIASVVVVDDELGWKDDSCELAGVERNGTMPCRRTSDPLDDDDRCPPPDTTWRWGGRLTSPNDDSTPLSSLFAPPSTNATEDDDDEDDDDDSAIPDDAADR
jgi:hypothetical protein